MELNCAVIGIGAMGKKYAVMLSGGKIKGLRLSAVCARSDASAEWAAANLGKDVVICRDEDELYGNPGIFDAVIIVTPHKLHPDMAIRALKAGKHVMCDKPAGATAADARRINDVAAKSDKIFAMMCHQRTYPQYKKIKQLLSEGAIGGIRRINLENSGFFRTVSYHKSSPWRSSWTGEGGGALINQGYHLIDMWRWLFGKPEAIYADIPYGKYNDFDVDDEDTLIMDYPGKVTGTFIISTGEGCPTERLEICGTRGKILLDGNILTVTRFESDIKEYAERAKVTSSQELGTAVERIEFEEPANAYGIMLENFAEAVTRGERVIAPGEESEDALEMINAAYLSAWRGEKVTLPINMREYIAILKQKEADEANKKR